MKHFIRKIDALVQKIQLKEIVVMYVLLFGTLKSIGNLIKLCVFSIGIVIV